MRRLSWAITMHERYGHPSSILYFDLNNFKNINDKYGHAAGDVAIRHVSQLLGTAARESDFLARIGGDEFAIIMYYATEEAARKRGSKIVEKLSQTPFVFNGRSVYISSSFGYYEVSSGDDAESALAAADMSMYVDKRRNKTSTLSGDAL
jgi:diguanylate cyclase (GGDEF)-like protein